MKAENHSLGPSLCPSVDYRQTTQSRGQAFNAGMRSGAEDVPHYSVVESRDLSGETIGICLGAEACNVSVRRLEGGLGLSALGSDIVSAGLRVTVTFSANGSKPEMCFNSSTTG